MPVYTKPVRLLMREMIETLEIGPGQTFTKDQVITWFAKAYPKIKVGTITAHLVRQSTNAKGRLHHNPRPDEDDLFFRLDSTRFRLYDPAQDPPPVRADQGQAGNHPEEEPESAASTEFAYEADLRNYLAKNLAAIEPGLRPYEEEGITGIEFPVGGRFIDILALDGSNNLVVIELKVSRGYDRVVGQLLRYIGWVRKHLAESRQQVRGVIVARDISEDLLLACAQLTGVTLVEYRLSLELTVVRPEVIG